jgi:hypothetical protein
MLCSCFTVEDCDFCQFIQNLLLLRTIKEEVDVQVSIANTSGQDLTPTQCRKVAFRTNTRLTHGFLGCVVHCHPSQCTLDTVCGVWVSLSGSHIGYHETAAVVGGVKDLEDNIDSSFEKDKEKGAKNGAVIGSKNKGKVVTAGSKKKKNNKTKHVSRHSCLDRKHVICAQGCLSADALDLDSNHGKKGEMPYPPCYS